jgi:sporulation protein YlmC with PRC-barrel domain
MLKLKKVTDVFGMKVFTDDGEYFGEVEEAILTKTKVYGWRVRSTRNSFLEKVIGDAKGVVVPHTLVKSFGDVVIISKGAIPSASTPIKDEE